MLELASQLASCYSLLYFISLHHDRASSISFISTSTTVLELPRLLLLLLLKLCYFSQLLFDSNTAWHIFVGCSTTATGFAVSSDFCSFFFPFCYYNENHRVTKRTAEIKACRGITRLVCFLFVQKKKSQNCMQCRGHQGWLVIVAHLS